MNYIQLNDIDFQKEFLRRFPHLLVIVEAKWSGPCQIMAPVIDSLSVEIKQYLHVAKLDYDSSKRNLHIYQAEDLPIFLFLKDGELEFQESGLIPKETLLKKIKEFTNADNS